MQTVVRIQGAAQTLSGSALEALQIAGNQPKMPLFATRLSADMQFSFYLGSGTTSTAEVCVR
jgi:hypothetical protein